jgi:hypothetical protein
MRKVKNTLKKKVIDGQTRECTIISMNEITEKEVKND